MGSWNEFGPKKQEVAPENDEFCELCAAAFTTPAGRILLKYLHERYVDTNHNETSSESALRSADAKRSLVRELEARTAVGLAQRTKAAKREQQT